MTYWLYELKLDPNHNKTEQSNKAVFDFRCNKDVVGHFNKQMPSYYQYRDSDYKGKMVSWLSHLYNENPITGKKVFIFRWGPDGLARSRSKKSIIYSNLDGAWPLFIPMLAWLQIYE